MPGFIYSSIEKDIRRDDDNMSSDIEINAIYEYLKAQTPLMALLNTTYLFKYNLEVPDLGKSGKAALVINLTGGDTPRSNHTMNPRLNCSIYADHDRNAQGEVITKNGIDKMYRIYRVLDPLLHWPDREPRILDGLRFLGSLRGVEPTLNQDRDVGLPYLWIAYDMNRVF